jgi:hypothetical protein
MVRTPKTPPPVILNGQVVEYAALPPSIRYSGARLHFVGRKELKELGWVPRLAIERELRTGAITLVYCRRDWSLVATYETDAIPKAKRRAERMYPGSSRYWKASGVTEVQAADYLAHRWDGFECSFCRRTPEGFDSLFENGVSRICNRCVEEFHAELTAKVRRE